MGIGDVGKKRMIEVLQDYRRKVGQEIMTHLQKISKNILRRNLILLLCKHFISLVDYPYCKNKDIFGKKRPVWQWVSETQLIYPGSCIVLKCSEYPRYVVYPLLMCQTQRDLLKLRRSKTAQFRIVCVTLILVILTYNSYQELKRIDC